VLHGHVSLSSRRRSSLSSSGCVTPGRRRGRGRLDSRPRNTSWRPLVKTARVELRPAATQQLRSEGAPRVSHLREQRTGDRGSGELRQIELGRGAGAASWRCGRSAPSGRTRRRARLDKLSQTWRGCRPSAPVLQARLLAVLAAARPHDRILKCTRGQALLLDGLDLVQVGAEAEPDTGESRCQRGCTCERRAKLSAFYLTETASSISNQTCSCALDMKARRALPASAWTACKCGVLMTNIPE